MSIRAKYINSIWGLQKAVKTDAFIQSSVSAPCLLSTHNDVDKVENEDMKLLIKRGPQFREPLSFNWRQNYVSIMNAV
jgi:hypothetical protein